MTLAQLRKLAESATSGPWAVEDEFEVKTQVEQSDVKRPSFPIVAVCSKRYRDDTYELSDDRASSNAEFIAALNPSTALRMIELLERAESIVIWAYSEGGIDSDCKQWLKDLEDL